VVFLSDNYITFRPDAGSSDATALSQSAQAQRFFMIASRLPLELHMVLCNRMYGSDRDTVSSKVSEPGFRWLTHVLGESM